MAPSHTASVNYWPDSACARAFWGQQELPPYRRMLRDTIAWLEPRPGDRWLDLGCGGGQMTQAIWEKSGGAVAEIVGLDCAAENAHAYQELRTAVQPPADPERIRFVCADFSSDLAVGGEARFDGVVSGLAIQYAESYSVAERRWTTAAYDRLLAEVCRVLKPGGTFVFSVNVPEPSWGRVALRCLKGVFRTRRPARYVTNSLQMMRYGSWLKREARQGRFHFLPLAVVMDKLTAAGFVVIENRLTYARQAYLFRCRKPA